MEKFKFKKNIDIGSLVAEDDPYLQKSFVNKGDINLITDINSPKCIIIGRTGSGKSALIKHIEENYNNTVKINPEELSLKYLSNSTILEYLRNLGVHLDLFYKILWKHIFIVEMLKLYFGVIDIRNQNWISEVYQKYFMNKRKKRAIEYLKEWEEKFWEKTEYRVKEIETKLSEKIMFEMGLSAKYFDQYIKSGVKDESYEEENKKIEVLHKAQKVINEIQADEIYEIIDIMQNDLFSKTPRKFYILIDDLDKEWVDKNIVYDLIKNLIVSINDLRKISNCKIVIALRENLFEMVAKFGNSRGMQREKYEHLHLHLNWTKNELETLINNRLKELMKNNFTKENPTVNDILPKFKNDKKNINGFEYILERSFYRPRDIISYFNIAMSKSEGHTTITKTVLRNTEKEYSQKRLSSIEDEWLENYGNLKHIYSFLKNKNEGFTLSNVNENDFIDFLLNDDLSTYSDYTLVLRKEYESSHNFERFVKKIMFILYRIGLIGIKLNAQEPILYSTQNVTQITDDDISIQTKFYIHKAFHLALNINALSIT